MSVFLAELLAAAALSTTSATTATTTAIVILRCSGSTSGPGSSTGSLTHRNRRTLDAIEVRLVLLVDLLALFVVIIEIFPALDQDGALIGARLAIVELVARTRRRWRCGFSTTIVDGLQEPRRRELTAPTWPFAP